MRKVALATILASCPFLFAAQASGQERIIQGTPAAPGSWDSTVALVYQVGSDKEVFCTGSVIAPQWVVTAAHCPLLLAKGFNGSNFSYPEIFARQTYDIRKANNEYTVDRVILHPRALREAIKALKKYNNAFSNKSFLAHDIALMHLETPTTAPSIAIKAPGEQNNLVKPWSVAEISGWGLMGGNWSPVLLQEAKMRMLSKKYCKRVDKYYLRSNMVCAGWPAGGAGACEGDSGGPLTVFTGGNRLLVGVASRVIRKNMTGNLCGGKNNPTVYIRTDRFYNWIQSVLGD